jgi:glucose/arabinose dehydrogenase
VLDPNFEGPSGFCAAMQPPAITFDAHSTPLGIAFLNQSAFPKEYQNDAIVALHGSWNRVNPSGYKLVRVKFKQNQPVEVTDFATGWLQGNTAWGRPVDTLIGPDGALYVSDDRSGLVYRIRYQGK